MRTLILIISIVILILSLYQIGQYLISAQDTKGLYRDMAGIYYEDVANSEAQEDKENPQSSDDAKSHSDNHGGNSRVDRLRGNKSGHNRLDNHSRYQDRLSRSQRKGQ